MVPGLVQHCVNEVEQRGLTEVGIYRVPGAERDVKELKVRGGEGRGGRGYGGEGSSGVV